MKNLGEKLFGLLCDADVDSARIDRGINYADHEMVGELQFHFSSVKAEVGGSSYNNYIRHIAK